MNSTVPAPDLRGLRHLPAIDGLRAVAVLAVVGYHADVRALRGGFLGVDVFFVVSGFLITALLLREVSVFGRVDLRSFWARRLRRLAPALAAFLISCAVYWYVFHRAELLGIRAQFAAAATYVSNWYLVATNGSYFAHLGRPSPLLHLWSLAVEEQFYLVWPLVIGLLARTNVVRHRKTLAGLFVVVAVGSSILMDALYRGHESIGVRSDPSRVYFGTDTRLTGLALGATLAALYVAKLGRDRFEAPGHSWTTGTWHVWRPKLLEGAGVVAAVLVAGSFVAVDDTEPWLYQGGFFVFSLLVVVVLAAAVDSKSIVLGRLLSWRPLRLIGTRAYGIYLWHWPVVVLTRPGVDVHFNSGAVLAIRVVTPLLLAELSYRIVEMPLRYRAADPEIRRGILTQLRQGLTAAVAIAIAGLTTFLVVSVRDTNVLRASSSNDVGIEESIREGQTFLSAQSSVDSPDELTASVSAPTSEPLESTVVAATDTTIPTETTVPPTPPRKGIPILVFGDSVMVGASPMIAKALGRNVRIEAEVGRQLVDSPQLLRKSLEENYPEVLIVNLGNNGPGDPDSLTKILQISSAVPLVIVSTVKVPKPWEASVNRQIFEEISSHPNMVIYDWNTIATRNRALLYSDNIHLNRVGAEEFVQGVSSIISRYCFPDAGAASPPTTRPTPTVAPTVERCIREPVPGFTPETTTTTSTAVAQTPLSPTTPAVTAIPRASTASTASTATSSTTTSTASTTSIAVGEVLATAPPTTRPERRATTTSTTTPTTPTTPPTTLAAAPPTTAATPTTSTTVVTAPTTAAPPGPTEPTTSATIAPTTMTTPATPATAQPPVDTTVTSPIASVGEPSTAAVPV